MKMRFNCANRLVLLRVCAPWGEPWMWWKFTWPSAVLCYILIHLHRSRFRCRSNTNF